jgi:flagellin-like hook-associated protein FlgL
MRLSTNQTYRLVLDGLQTNFSRMVRSAEQAATGRRINRPSDDPTGAALTLGFERRMADIGRSVEAARDGRAVVDGAAAVLEEVSGLMAEVRALVVQGMNGTLDPQARSAIGDQVALLREQLVTLANSRQGNRYLFAGSDSAARPFDVDANGRVVYTGDGVQQKVRVGSGVSIPINVAGSELFMAAQGMTVSLSGLTGIALGSTANQGDGVETLTVRHDATDLSSLASSGITSANGGLSDTFVGVGNLVVDTAAGTVRLGDGPAVALPVSGSPDYSDFVVANAAGGEVHLDFSGWSGGDVAGPVTGSASVSLDGVAFTSVDFTETDLRLENPTTGSIVHVNTQGLERAGAELLHFSGEVSVFDVLDSIASDLSNSAAFDSEDIVKRLGLGLGELDRHHDNVLNGLGVLGSRSARLDDAATRLEALDVQVSAQLSTVRDADLSEAVLDLQRNEQILQLSQAAGTRLLQTSLLNFLQ